MIRTAIFAALCALVVTPVQAQSGPGPSPEELLALSFYYQQQNEASVRSELQRLRVRYPDWEPPKDLSRLTQNSPSTEIDEIYRQIGAGQFAEARASILATRTTYPDWSPPAEMMTLLETNEGQGLLDLAFEEKNLDRALSLAGERPSLLRCDRVNNAWRIADAQKASGLTADAFGTYRAVLGACVKPNDIIATLEKASAVASPEQLQELFTQTKERFPELSDKLLPLQDRLQGGGAPQSVTGTPVKTKKEEPKKGEAPVRKASPTKPASKSEPTPRSNRANAATGSTTGIYQQAWQTYNLDRPMEAIAQFDTALRGRLDSTQRRDAQYGRALSYLKMRMPDNASRIAAGTDLTRKQRIDVERQILDQRGVAAYKRGDYRRAIEFFDAIQGLTGGLRRDLDVLRAYAFLNSNQRGRAQQEFTRLNNDLATAETRRGLKAAMD